MMCMSRKLPWKPMKSLCEVHCPVQLPTPACSQAVLLQPGSQFYEHVASLQSYEGENI